MLLASIFEEKNKMNILRFMEEFPTEEACKAHFKVKREQEGIKCKKVEKHIING